MGERVSVQVEGRPAPPLRPFVTSYVGYLLRFERAHRLVAEDDAPSWAKVSATAGYADQAHLVRAWREFTGRSPTAWREDEVLGGPGKG